MQEVWKDIEGYEGYYQVSNLGRVRGVDRIVERKDGTTQRVSGKLLTPKGYADSHHYAAVHLRKGSSNRTVEVHRLVAYAFVPNPNKMGVVDHIDGDMFNNMASNLRWCTQADNLRFCREAGRAKFPHFNEWPEDVQRRYIDRQKNPIVRSDGKYYACTADAAKDLGVTYSAVSHVLRGLTETCQGYSFTYAKKQE